MKSLFKYLSRVTLIIIIVGWVVLIFFSSPDSLINWIGVENGYLLVGLFALISGLSLFGTAPYHLVLAALAAGGLDPILLALAAVIGLAIGDSTSYFLGYEGRAIIPQKAEKVVERISYFLKLHDKHLSVYIFLYGALIPFSNDFIGVTLGLVRYNFLRAMIPLMLGTFIFNCAVALGSPYAYDLFSTFF